MSGFDNEVVYARGMRLQASTAQDILLMQATATDVSRINHVGNPNGSVSANPSSLCHDPVSGTIYFKETGTGNTGWAPIGTVTNDYHDSRFIVSAGGAADGANYTTIASAISAAVSAGGVQNIAIQPGTYTEDLTLQPNINLVAYDASAFTPTVTIKGKATFTQAGSVCLSGIYLQTNSDYFLVVSGSAASKVVLNNCYLDCLNNTGISYTSSDTGSKITLFNCLGNLATTGIAVIISSGAGMPGSGLAGILIKNCKFSNTGGSTTANSTSACIARIQNSMFENPFNSSSTGAVSIQHSIIACINLNTTAVTTSGTTISEISNSQVNSGSASAVSIGAGTTMQMYESTVNSSNTNALTGAGTLQISEVSFTGSSSGVNVTTVNASPVGIASLQFLTATGTTGSSVSKSMNYYEEGTWTPTLNGATPGTTTYTSQNGYYTRIGNMVFVCGTIVLTAATGTGNAQIGALPFTVKNQTNGTFRGNVLVNASGWAWPASTTTCSLVFTINNTTATIACFGNGVGSNSLQMTNASATFTFSGCYQV